MEIKTKLAILSMLAKKLNEEHITWCVGGSLLLYFQGISSHFNDIDIMIAENDIEKVNLLFSTLGNLKQQDENINYQSTFFKTFIIDDLEVDIIAGFTIIAEDKRYYFPLNSRDIQECTVINSESIPLHQLSEWLKYYQLMDRLDKVQMIADYYK